MSFTIAVAGKGGTGKSTLAALIIRYFLEKELTPVLAVDADADANLADLLDLESKKTVGRIREEVFENVSKIPAGIPKEAFFEAKIEEVLIEAKGFDLLVMGRPEGSGCYCYANNLLRKYVDHLSQSYPYVIMDNQAGMEHLSRHTTQDVDVLLIVSDPSIRGVKTAGKISKLVDELGLLVKERFLVINRALSRLPSSLLREVEGQKLLLVETIPYDEEIVTFELERKPLLRLGKTSVGVKSVEEAMKKIGIKYSSSPKSKVQSPRSG